MEITRGKIRKAMKVVIYGPEGIGKSTLASRFPDPVFIDTEGSTTSMDVSRLPAPTSWIMLLSEVDYVKKNPTCCKTLVIDTADWAEQLCIRQVCDSHHIDGIEDMGYGKGYVYVKESFGKLLNQLSDLVESGINVVLTAHAMMRKFEQPDELGAYDRWELKLSKQTSPLVKEWSDMLLFCNYKTLVVNVDNHGAAKGKNKARGGKRVIYTQHHPCWDAKNRFGLPDEMDMDYESIREAVEGSAPADPSQKPKEAAAVASAPASEPERKVEANPELIKEMKQNTLEPAAPPADEDPASAEKSQEETAPETTHKPVSDLLSDPDRLPQNLKDLMKNDAIDEWDIQRAVAFKGYYPENTLIQDMDPEFIQGWIIAYWPQVKALALKIKSEEVIPFN